MKWTILFLLLPLFGVSQGTAFFETTIYFEDAIGNKDSLVVGHDENANSSYNPDFGEIDITMPWDSVFEVRGTHFLDWYTIDDKLLLSKKIIGSGEGGITQGGDCLSFNTPIVIFANVKNLPLKISWDKSAFSNSICRNRSTITPNVLPMITERWYESLEENIDYCCMAENDSVDFYTFRVNDGFGFHLIDQIENNTVDTMVALLLNFRFQNAWDTPCTAVVGTDEIGSSSSDIDIFPNPSHNEINIKGNKFSNWYILNQESKLIMKGNGNSVNIEKLKEGIYYISLFDNDGNLLKTKKIVKIDTP